TPGDTGAARPRRPNRTSLWVSPSQPRGSGYHCTKGDDPTSGSLGSPVMIKFLEGQETKNMCLVALLFRSVSDEPLIVGANSEEFYHRGGELPQLLDGPCRIVAGLDPVAKGTWLGVNERGVLVAVTNRPRLQVPARPRSRGLLARDLLACPSAKVAVELAAE